MATLYTDNETGRKIRVEGEGTPTEAELIQLFKEAYPEKTTKEKVVDVAKAAAPIAGDVAVELGGATLGQALGAPAGPIGMSVGGFVGGSVGNAAAQWRRLQRGDQKEFDWTEMLRSGSISAVPVAGLARGATTVAKAANAAKVGGIMGGNAALNSYVDTGDVNLPGALTAAVGGAMTGRLAGPQMASNATGRAEKAIYDAEMAAVKKGQAMTKVEGEIAKANEALSTRDLRSIAPSIQSRLLGEGDRISLVGEGATADYYKVMDQLERLDRRFGVGAGAEKERSRINKKLQELLGEK